MRILSCISVLAFCLATLLFSGCGPRPLSTPADAVEVDLPVIVHLQTRHAMVTVMAGPEGHLYTVRDHEGRLLGRHLSERQLQSRAPEIHDLLKRSYASDEGLDVIWAGMLEHDRLE